jgi:transcriptional regulator with XRE-family HTH domain
MPPKVKLARSVRPVRVPATVSIAAQGQRIGMLREILDWSNKEMAVRTGIPEPSLSQFIYGRKKSIHSLDIYRIAAATGTDANFIIYGNTKCLTVLWRKRIRKFAR